MTIFQSKLSRTKTEMTKDQQRENHLKWTTYVQRRVINVVVKQDESISVSCVRKNKRRFIEILYETMKRNRNALDFIRYIVLYKSQ